MLATLVNLYKQISMDITSFNQIITSRRSVLPKDYEAGKIDDQIIWQILKNANWAPTHK